ncbi:MAG: ribbon-helix-helix protein, CopG family [Chloroflexota bacterium]|nr:MAG: ribbon-helix-helix protein, CopG family [Chloroflexota bacterium]
MVVVYIDLVKRVQIYIEPEMDRALAAAAARERISKAALIRRYVAERIGFPRVDSGTLDDLVGAYDEAPGSIDEVVYGR